MSNLARMRDRQSAAPILPVDLLGVRFAALADPTRRAILAHLCMGEAPVNDLVAPFAMSLPAISRYLNDDRSRR
jgi:hypothetical protein